MASSRTVPRLDKASAAAQSAMRVSDALGERRAIWLDRLIDTGGWVHQVVQYSVADIGGQLPNGNIIPSEYVIETWIKVDSAGQVIASQDVMTDLNGNVVQSGYTVNGRTINADSRLDVAAPSVNLRASIAPDELVSSYRAQGGELSSERLATGEMRLSLVQHLVAAEDISGQSSPQVSTLTQIDYGVDGQVLRSQTTAILANGAEISTSGYTVKILESGVKPPADVLTLLEKSEETK
ncbi:MAG TPA: hypothetical protein PLC98_23250 [Anaerolineales bacterium]|nr:hypothetical protein [Anaerolineales bacterium]